MNPNPMEDMPTLLKPEASPAEAPTLDHAGPVPGELGPAPPGYQLLREIGRGGMAVVFLAQHLSLKRLVALKMILGGASAGHDRLGRLRIEAEAIAKLRHPHLVQIYEVGEWQGQPYLVLEYAAQGSLDKKLAGTPIPGQEAARLAAALADAMQCAHGQGIVHRDLKPANILLEPLSADSRSSMTKPSQGAIEEETPIQQCLPKITDFGLAKLLDSTSGQTATGAILGTPSYMAPEQAGGQLKEIGPWTDIYAIGAILYEMLTGRPPFKAATPIDTAMQVIHGEPVPPSQLQPKTPRDLETICLKCLQKEPKKRYASAQALADDLRRFLNEEPILARPIGVGERMVKWVRRRPAGAGLMALLFLSLTTGMVISWWLYWGVRFERDRAEQFSQQYKEQYQDAQQARKQALEKAEAERRSAYTQRLMAAQYAWSVNNIAHVEQTLNESPEEYRSFEWYYLNKLLHGERFMMPAFHRMAASLDGQWLAYLDLQDVSVDSVLASETPLDEDPAPKGTFVISICNATTQKRTRQILIGSDLPQALALSPDGRTLLASFASVEAGKPDVQPSGRLVLWQVETGKEIARWDKLPAEITCLAFHPTKPLVACGHRWTHLPDPQKHIYVISLLNLESRQFELRLEAKRIIDRLIGSLPARSSEVRMASVHFNADGSVLTANQDTSKGSQFLVWKMTDPKPTANMIFNVSPLFQITMSLITGCVPDETGEMGFVSIRSDRAFSFGRGQPRIFGFHLIEHLRKTTWTLEGVDLSCLAVEQRSPGRLAIAHLDGTIELLNRENGQVLKTFRGHVGEVRSLAFLAPSRSLASLGTDGTLRVWSLDDPKPIEGSGLAAATTHIDPTREILVSQIMGASSTFNPTIQLDRINVETQKRTTQFIIPDLDAYGGIMSLTFSSRGGMIVVPILELAEKDPKKRRGIGLMELRERSKPKLQVWDTRSKQKVFEVEWKHDINTLWIQGMMAVSDNGQWVATRHIEEKVETEAPDKEVDHFLSTHIQLWQRPGTGNAHLLALPNVAFAFHPTEPVLFVLTKKKRGENKQILLELLAIDCHTGKIQATWPYELKAQYGLMGSYNHLAVSEDGQMVAASVMDNSFLPEQSLVEKNSGMALRHLSAPIVVWDLAKKQVRTYGGMGPTLFSPDHRRLVSSNRDGTALWLWDVQAEAAQQPILTLKNEVGGKPFYLSFSADGLQLVMSPLTRIVTKNQIQVWQGMPPSDGPR